MSEASRENLLDRALRALTVVDVWRKAGLPNLPQRNVGLFKSPFTSEHRHGDRRPSFSIFRDGQGWRNHATNESGAVWHFACKAFPGLDKKDVAKLLIDMAGLSEDRGGKVVPVNFKKLQKRQETEAKKEFYRRRECFLSVDSLPAEIPHVPAWDSAVESRFREPVSGWASCIEGALKKLAGSRSWPLHWARSIVEDGLVSFPLVPWTEQGWRYAKRCKAFAVEAPTQAGSDPGRIHLKTVGYHQRVYFDGRKSWVYVPFVPRSRRQLNPFSNRLRLINRSIPPLPFVLGDLDRPGLVVITEGQWDAVTFWGACGWFGGDASFPGGVAVFGLRGASSADVFINFYGRWLNACRPDVLMLADADEAGARLYEQDWRRRSDVPFVDRLKALGARRVVVSMPSQPGAKDFNDYWRIRQVNPGEIYQWLSDLGLSAHRRQTA